VVLEDGELHTLSWPEESKEQASRRARQAMDHVFRPDQYGPPSGGPSWARATDQGLRALPDLPGRRPEAAAKPFPWVVGMGVLQPK
jgi:hypothetical protein